MIFVETSSTGGSAPSRRCPPLSACLPIWALCAACPIQPRSAEALSGLSVSAQVTALISPVGICTYQVQPLGRDNRGLTWVDACRLLRSSVDLGLGLWLDVEVSVVRSDRHEEVMQEAFEPGQAEGMGPWIAEPDRRVSGELI